MKYLFVKKIKLALILTEHTARVSGLFPRSWCFISELWRHNVAFKVNFVYLILKPWFTYFCLYFVYVKFLNIIKKKNPKNSHTVHTIAIIVHPFFLADSCIFFLCSDQIDIYIFDPALQRIKKTSHEAINQTWTSSCSSWHSVTTLVRWHV